MDQLVLFCRESQEGKHKHLDIFELIPQVFLPNHKGPRAEKKISLHGTQQHRPALHERHSLQDFLWIPGPVSDLDPSFAEPQTEMVLTIRKSRGCSVHVGKFSLILPCPVSPQLHQAPRTHSPHQSLSLLKQSTRLW